MSSAIGQKIYTCNLTSLTDFHLKMIVKKELFAIIVGSWDFLLQKSATVFISSFIYKVKTPSFDASNRDLARTSLGGLVRAGSEQGASKVRTERQGKAEFDLKKEHALGHRYWEILKTKQTQNFWICRKCFCMAYVFKGYRYRNCFGEKVFMINLLGEEIRLFRIENRFSNPFLEILYNREAGYWQIILRYIF